MNAIEFVDPATGLPSPEFTKSTRCSGKQGLLLLSCGTYANVIRFLFPLTIQDNVFDEGLAILESVLVETAKAKTAPFFNSSHSNGAGEKPCLAVSRFTFQATHGHCQQTQAIISGSSFLKDSLC